MKNSLGVQSIGLALALGLCNMTAPFSRAHAEADIVAALKLVTVMGAGAVVAGVGGGLAAAYCADLARGAMRLVQDAKTYPQRKRYRQALKAEANVRGPQLEAIAGKLAAQLAAKGFESTPRSSGVMMKLVAIRDQFAGIGPFAPGQYPVSVVAKDTGGGQFHEDFKPRLIVDHDSLVLANEQNPSALQEVDALVVTFGTSKLIPTAEILVPFFTPQAVTKALQQTKQAFAENGLTPTIEIEQSHWRSSSYRLVEQFIKWKIKGAQSDEEYIAANLLALEVVASVAINLEQGGYITPKEVAKREAEKAERESRQYFGRPGPL